MLVYLLLSFVWRFKSLRGVFGIKKLIYLKKIVMLLKGCHLRLSIPLELVNKYLNTVPLILL
jgi:hypothetical protein